MNTADTAYNQLLIDILKNGKVHHNRTGVDTKSVFGRQLRFNLQEGFPLLTCKKVWFKGVLHELLWFLGAVPEEYKRLEQTNIKYLVDNDVHIWDEWPYKKYCESHSKLGSDGLMSVTPIEYSKEGFIKLIKYDWDFAAKWGNLGPVYGEQWTNWRTHNTIEIPIPGDQVVEIYETINQIEQVIKTLIDNPDDRRMIVTAWNPGEIDEMLLPPCHYSFQFKSEELDYDERLKIACKPENGVLPVVPMYPTQKEMEAFLDEKKIPKRRLSLLWNQRSVDTFLGLPFNIASYAALLLMVAHVTNHVAGDLIFSGGDVHIYTNHTKQVNEQLKREPKALPELELNEKVKNIFDFRYDDFKLIGYDPHPAIKADVAV